MKTSPQTHFKNFERKPEKKKNQEESYFQLGRTVLYKLSCFYLFIIILFKKVKWKLE